MKRADAERLRNATCLGCGYALRELTTNTCPECGRGFDPGDPSTMAHIRTSILPPWLADMPMGWPMTIASALLALMLLIEASAPGHDQGFTCCFGVMLGGVSLVWLLRVAVQIPRMDRFWRSWIIVPLIGMATYALIQMKAPLLTRFWISKPFLEGHLGSPASSRIIGLFRVTHTEVSSGITFFFTAEGIDAAGIMYVPAGAASEEYVFEEHSLGNGWFTFVQHPSFD